MFPEAFLSGYPRGLSFGAVVGNRTTEGRDHYRRYWEAAVDVPGPVIDRIGEPYVTSRGRARDGEEMTGLGLGFFIAKTLLERSGAVLAFLNRSPPEHGAVVSVRWARRDFEPLDTHATALVR